MDAKEWVLKRTVKLLQQVEKLEKQYFLIKTDFFQKP